MLKNISIKGAAIGLLFLVILSFIVSPWLTSALSSGLMDNVAWKNGGLLDPNGDPLAILSLFSYVLTGILMVKIFKQVTMGTAIIAAIPYALFQLYNYGGYSTYYGPVVGPFLVISAIVGLTVFGVYFASKIKFAK